MFAVSFVGGIFSMVLYTSKWTLIATWTQCTVVILGGIAVYFDTYKRAAQAVQQWKGIEGRFTFEYLTSDAESHFVKISYKMSCSQMTLKYLFSTQILLKISWEQHWLWLL